MRVVSSTLAAAIEAGERAITARIGVDWDKDGITYGPSSLDDLSRYAGAVTVSHDLTGDLPEEVAAVEGSAAGAGTVDLAAGDPDDDRRTAAWTFSDLNPSSPFAGLERLARPAELDIGFRGLGSVEYLRLLTGRTRGLPVDAGAGSATLDLLDMREALRTKVRLPAVAADAPDLGVAQPVIKHGMEATWIVSYVLWLCGIYTAPPQRTGCRYYAPMHGSTYPFIGATSAPKPDGYATSVSVQDGYLGVVESGELVEKRAEFETGPYLLGTVSRADGGTYLDAPLAAGTALSAGGRGAGRLEFWFKTPSFTPGQTSGFAIRVGDTDPLGPDPYFDINILGSTSVFGTLRLRDSTGTLASGPTITASNSWQFIGVHWDMSGSGSVKFRYNGVTTTVVPSATGPLWFVPENEPRLTSTGVAGGALAEVMVHTGLLGSDPFMDSSPNLPFTAGAVVDRSVQRLDGIVPGDPADAWELLADLAKAELASSFFSEEGVYQFRTAARLDSAQGQTVQQTITSDTDIMDVAYSLAIDQVRNVVTASASNVAVSPGTELYNADTKIWLPAKKSLTLQVPVDAAVISVDDIEYEARIASAGGGSNLASKVTISVDLVDASTLALTFANSNNLPLWLVNSSGDPFLIVSGVTLSSSDSAAKYTFTDEPSVAEYGEQPLDLPSNPWRQRDVDAAGIAQRVATELARPRPTITGLQVVGDPRRERGDRVRLRAREIELDRDYWLTNISHVISADGAYTQQISARAARTTGVWDTTVWDDPDSMWGV